MLVTRQVRDPIGSSPEHSGKNRIEKIFDSDLVSFRFIRQTDQFETFLPNKSNKPNRPKIYTSYFWFSTRFTEL